MSTQRLAFIIAAILAGRALTAAVTPSAQRRPQAVLRACATCTYTSIGAAVTAANPGDEIQVAGGTFTESVSIAKRVAPRGS